MMFFHSLEASRGSANVTGALMKLQGSSHPDDLESESENQIPIENPSLKVEVPTSHPDQGTQSTTHKQHESEDDDLPKVEEVPILWRTQGHNLHFQVGSHQVNNLHRGFRGHKRDGSSSAWQMCLLLYGYMACMCLWFVAKGHMPPPKAILQKIAEERGFVAKKEKVEEKK